MPFSRQKLVILSESALSESAADLSQIGFECAGWKRRPLGLRIRLLNKILSSRAERDWPRTMPAGKGARSRGTLVQAGFRKNLDPSTRVSRAGEFAREPSLAQDDSFVLVRRGRPRPRQYVIKSIHGFPPLDFFYRRRYRTFLRHLSAVCDPSLSPSRSARVGGCAGHRPLGALGHAALRRRGGISLIAIVAAIIAAGADRITLCCRSGHPFGGFRAGEYLRAHVSSQSLAALRCQRPGGN